MKIPDCNATVQILCGYRRLGCNFGDLPDFLELEIRMSNFTSRKILPVDLLNYKGVKSYCPPLLCTRHKAIALFNQELSEQLVSGKYETGYFLDQNGAVTFPDGSLGFVRGGEFIGKCSRPYLIAPEISDVQLMGTDRTLSQLPALLLSSPPQVLLVLAYVVMASIRSLLIQGGVDLQAVLYIEGGQSLGKTTLATRIAGIYQSTDRTIGIIQAGSTHAAVNDALVTLRDQPVVIDDLCLSASKSIVRKRVELLSQLIRQGTGSQPIIKKKGNATVVLPCGAGLIFTAEFALENLSDLTRCIIVPVKSKLNLSQDLTPALIGAAIRFYSEWLTRHYQGEILYFTQRVSKLEDSDLNQRMKTNYGCMLVAFQSLLRALRDLGITEDTAHYLNDRMSAEISEALAEHQSLIDQANEKRPVGNLAYCIMDAYENGAFRIAKSPKNLVNKDGILWKDDLCLRPESLIQIIRFQPGYHDWTATQITRSLKDIRALVLQEDNAATVHLKKGTPRVYRLRINTLEKCAERY